MRVAYHIPHPGGVGADRWICDAWREGFQRLGHEFVVVSSLGELAETRAAQTPTLLFTAINLLDSESWVPALHRLRKAGTKVLLWVHWPLVPSVDRRLADILKHDDIADVYFGERESEQMAQFEAETGKKYHVIANAANPALHFPAKPTAKYQYDLVYLGANLKHKRWFAENVLRPLKARYRIGLFGPGWTARDQVLRAISKASRHAGFTGVARLVDRRRITVPPEEENVLYSSAKICLNFHEREPDGSQPHYIVNQRTFKIPACGGFQICDDVPAIRKYFADDEIVLASLDAREWHDKIEYYLAHDDERRQIQAKGTRRALQEHLSTHRVRQVLSLLGIQERHVG
ncbi:CgeB family protein [Nitrospira sp. Kam-Ns4a]